MYRDELRPTRVDVTAHDERSMRVLEIVISFAAIASVVFLSLPR